MRRLLAELIDHPVDDALIEIFAAEEGVAGRGKHLKDAVVHFENRDVERAAAEIVDGDAFRACAAQTVGERGGGRLVDDALDLSPASFPASFVACRCVSSK